MNKLVLERGPAYAGFFLSMSEISGSINFLRVLYARMVYRLHFFAVWIIV